MNWPHSKFDLLRFANITTGVHSRSLAWLTISETWLPVCQSCQFISLFGKYHILLWKFRLVNFKRLTAITIAQLMLIFALPSAISFNKSFCYWWWTWFYRQYVVCIPFWEWVIKDGFADEHKPQHQNWEFWHLFLYFTHVFLLRCLPQTRLGGQTKTFVGVSPEGA